MNLLDLGILAILLLVGLRGYYRGLFQELSVIIGLLGGIVVAAHLYRDVADFLSQWIKTPLYNQVLGFLLILTIVYWLTRGVGHLLQRVFMMLYLERFDRLLGSLFALAKGMLVLGFILTSLHLVIPKDSRLLRESRTAPYLQSFYHQALGLLPPEFKEQMKQQVHNWHKKWDQPAAPREALEEPVEPSEELE